MILIVTHKSDFTADFVIDKLNRDGIEYHRLNCEDINNAYYSLNIADTNLIGQFNLNKVKSVWYRRTMLPSVNALLTPEEKNFILQSYKSLLENLLSTIEAKWLSDPNLIHKAENKLLQLKKAQKLGFRIPKTIVTNDPKSVKILHSECNSELIIKPIHSGRVEDDDKMRLIFANKINKDHLENLSNFDLTPCIFQEFIKKEIDIRVTVVGDKVFSAFVDSQSDEETKTDWRRKKQPFKVYELPISIQNKCIEITKSLGLNFGAIDLVKTNKNEYYFLEINPNGQWAWIEIDTGLPISKEIINYLNN